MAEHLGHRVNVCLQGFARCPEPVGEEPEFLPAELLLARFLVRVLLSTSQVSGRAVRMLMLRFDFVTSDVTIQDQSRKCLTSRLLQIESLRALCTTT